jgi:hypothetical protein
LPRVGALDEPRGANGDGLIDRARSNPRMVVVIAAGAILVLAWFGWAIYVTSSNGASAGLGVVIAWPAMLAALALISLPFIGGYLLVRRLSMESGAPAAEEAEDTEAEDEGSDGEDGPGDEEEASEDGDEGSEEEDDSEEDEDPDDESEDAEPDAEKTAG